MRRRRPPQDDLHNKERWLISYADFITLLFAFFVVMYSVSSVNEGKYKVLSETFNFDEEEVHDSEEEQELAGAKTSVLEPYSLGDLLNDEQAYRRKGVPESDSDEDSYYNFDNIGTNMVNSKQMKKIKLLTRDHNNNSKSMKNFYSFPVEDNECTESQLETKY